MFKSTLLFLTFLLLSPQNTKAQDTISTSIYFQSASSDLDAAAKKKISDLRNQLNENSIQSITVYGYCDDVGGTVKNQILSNNRANAVRMFMSEMKFPTNKNDVTRGWSEVSLLQNSNLPIADQRRQNRRVDVCIVKKTFVVEEVPEPELIVTKKPQLDNSLKVGDKVTLENILFIGGRDLLLPESYEALDELIFFMKKYPQYRITILGHVCCQTDGRDGLDNETQLRNLSLVRAMRIYNILIEKGISKSRLAYKGMKGEFPTGLGEYADRRVEIEISGID